ncbi:MULTISPECIES: TIGR02328 family protein [Desulfosporosinus]|nr:MULTISPECIES: TIGR02328 family protein [Desulfosporosinus]
MRLWHQDLLPFLPRAQLLGQHRECCALRGKGWGKRHSTVDYVFAYDVEKLVSFHRLVLNEMKRRGYKPDQQWYTPEYRGKNIGPWVGLSLEKSDIPVAAHIYPEHDKAYLEECLLNLRQKGIELKVPINEDSCPP